MNSVNISPAVIATLIKTPEQPISCQIANAEATLTIAISHYTEKLQNHYGENIFPDIEKACQRSGIDYQTKHFGLHIAFEQPTELDLHDAQLNLLGDLKSLIKHFEVVTIENAHLHHQFKDIGHRNRFPHLKFHRDRNETQPTPYSLYTRDPRCPEQHQPRISSTLFISNLVAYLQCMFERDYGQLKQQGPQSHYDIFYQTEMRDIINKVVLEHRWDKPAGTGEIAMLDNRTTLHASFLRDKIHHGYRIGVRYLK